MKKSAMRAMSMVFIGLCAIQWSPGHSGRISEEESFSSPSASSAFPYAIVFVSRNRISDAKNDPCAVPGLGPVYRTAAVGGKLMVRETDGTLRVLVGKDRLYDVADPCAFWDASRVLFSGLVHPDSSWRIYEVGVDGFGFRQLTRTDRRTDLSQFGPSASAFVRYDDFDPCYLPDGRICFASTRYPSMASYDRILTSNIFLANADGSGIRRITTERNGGEEPAIDPVSGRIVYARWWVNRDRPSNIARHGLSRDDRQALTSDVANIWQAVTVRSDAEGLKLYAGFPRTRKGMQAYKPALLDDGRIISVFTPNTSMTPFIGGTGIRWFRKGAGVEHYIAGVRSSEILAFTEPPYAADAVAVDSTLLVLSYSPTGQDFGLFSCGLDGSAVREIVNFRGTHELEPEVLRSRKIPPVLEEEFPYPTSELPPTEDPRTYFKNDTFRFDCMNMFANGAVDEPMPDAPRITVGARIRFFMNVQRKNASVPDPSIYLKDAPVFLSGGIHEHELPADVPVFEQVVGPDGKVLEAPGGNFAHVTGMNFERMGAGTKCVGCHAGHSMLTVPLNGSMAEWINVSPSALATASSHIRTADGVPLFPQRVVDRQARTGGDTVAWVSEEGPGASVRLRWEIPIEVREFVLYGIRTKPEEGITLSVHDCEILLYYKDSLVLKVASSGEIREDGTRVQVSPTNIDSAVFTIKNASGVVFHRPITGLAEIETFARISRLNYHIIPEG